MNLNFFFCQLSQNNRRLSKLFCWQIKIILQVKFRLISVLGQSTKPTSLTVEKSCEVWLIKVRTESCDKGYIELRKHRKEEEGILMHCFPPLNQYGTLFSLGFPSSSSSSISVFYGFDCGCQHIDGWYINNTLLFKKRKYVGWLSSLSTIQFRLCRMKI